MICAFMLNSLGHGRAMTVNQLETRGDLVTSTVQAEPGNLRRRRIFAVRSARFSCSDLDWCSRISQRPGPHCSEGHTRLAWLDEAGPLLIENRNPSADRAAWRTLPCGRLVGTRKYAAKEACSLVGKRSH